MTRRTIRASSDAAAPAFVEALATTRRQLRETGETLQVADRLTLSLEGVAALAYGDLARRRATADGAVCVRERIVHVYPELESYEWRLKVARDIIDNLDQPTTPIAP